MRRLFKRLNARWGPGFQSDTAFIEAAFREILGRNADRDGLTHYRRVLQAGLGRTAVLLDIMRSKGIQGDASAVNLDPSGSPGPEAAAVQSRDRPDEREDVIRQIAAGRSRVTS